MNNRILLVDDDNNILDAFQRNLRYKFELVTATNGIDGISMLNEQGPFAVIVSDYRMPNMDGIQFLSKARQIAPDTVRMMLTGQADLQVAIDAVNEGNLFRFLSKPCPTNAFVKALTAGVEQYKLVTAERELLEKTLKGSVKILIDILSILNPVAFSQSSRIRLLTRKLAVRLRIKHLWEIELASMLSLIGCISIPWDILEKKYQGKELSSRENEIFLAHPEVGQSLLINIPRFERIAEAVAYQEKHYDGGGVPSDNRNGVNIPISARLLKVAMDFNILLGTGIARDRAFQMMSTKHNIYDPDIMAALEAEILSVKEGYTLKAVALKDITTGMVLADDVRDKKGSLLIPREQEITDVLKIRLLNFTRFSSVAEPIKILDIIAKR